MKRTRIKPQSAKRRKANRERRRNLYEEYGTNPMCRFPACGAPAWDGHEILSRARGGSITEVSNIVPLCRSHHSFITENPPWAEANGWALPSWGAA